MGKTRRVIRLFFNTFYDDEAKKVLGELEKILGRIDVRRSRVVPELYYVEALLPEDAGEEEARSLLERALEAARSGGPGIFGVKGYFILGEE